MNVQSASPFPRSRAAMDVIARASMGMRGNNAARPALLAEFEARFRTIDLRREVKRGTSVYNGIFNLLVLKGARDWVTGTVPQHDDLDDHHIVPKAWGREHEQRTLVDTILNRTPLTADTNRNIIRDRLPNAYLPELIAQNGESQVRATLESHFISPIAFDILLRAPFTPDDFEEFLTERQRTLQDAIEDLLIKERLDLAPRLRELDADLETIELALRAGIVAGLESDVTRLPSHLRQKIDERLQAAAKRTPALDRERLATLAGMLEYADLRELQDVLTNKALWPAFQPRFGSKELLLQRFSQTADLRNSIRHSRQVDEITRKEGEAAILWFRRVLDV